MKKGLFVIIATFAFILLPSCKDDAKVTDLANAKIKISGSRSIAKVNVKSNVSQDTTKFMSDNEIVKKFYNFIWTNEWGMESSMGLIPERRDTVNNVLVMLGIDVLYGEYPNYTIQERTLLYANDLKIVVRDVDSLGKYTYMVAAYIPSEQLLTARTKIQNAFDKGEYDECLKALQSAIKFYPIEPYKYIQGK